MRVDVPQAIRDATEEIHVHPTGRELKDVLETALVDAREQARLRGRRFRGPWLPVEERHFAEEVPGVDVTKRLLFAAATRLGNFYRAFADEIKRIAALAFLENNVA